MQDAICLLPVVAVRKEPSHRSEMVNQLLFGEYAMVGEERDEFVFVRCSYDGYEGWVQAKQLTFIDSKDVLQPGAYTTDFATPLTKNGSLLYIPFAAPLFGETGKDFKVATMSFTYLQPPRRTWKINSVKFSEESLAATYQPYLNAPYLWGGKSVWGTDCSGFVQQVFKLFGIKLLRDAYLQAEQGTAVSSFTEARVGDLAFFQNEKGRITHVGLVLSGKKIVHASGEVRIDKLDEKGIFIETTNHRTHELHSIRRFF